MTRVLTIGTFDTPHMGHAAFLRQCEKYGEVIVGVNTDEFVIHYKGTRPMFDLIERETLISKLGYPTHPNPSAGQELIRRVMPDVIAVGSDWARKDYLKQIDVTQDWLDLHDISVIYIPYTQGISSTELKKRCGQ